MKGVKGVSDAGTRRWQGWAQPSREDATILAVGWARVCGGMGRVGWAEWDIQSGMGTSLKNSARGIRAAILLTGRRLMWRGLMTARPTPLGGHTALLARGWEEWEEWGGVGGVGGVCVCARARARACACACACVVCLCHLRWDGQSGMGRVGYPKGDGHQPQKTPRVVFARRFC